jgi:hypothetical protein
LTGKRGYFGSCHKLRASGIHTQRHTHTTQIHRMGQQPPRADDDTPSVGRSRHVADLTVTQLLDDYSEVSPSTTLQRGLSGASKAIGPG